MKYLGNLPIINVVALTGFLLMQSFPAYASCEPNDFDYDPSECPSVETEKKAEPALKATGAEEDSSKILTATVQKIPGL